MRNLAVHDDDAFDALIERIDAGLDLRDHAARDGAVGDQAARVGDRQFADERLRLVEHARHVGQQQQALGLERAGNGASESVGIDVEGAAFGRRGDRRQHRDHLLAENGVENEQIDRVRFADETEVDDLLDIGIGIDHGARDLLGLHHVAVFAAQADGLAAGVVDVADDLFVDRAGQHHFDDVDGGGVGDAQARGEVGFDAELLEHGRDLRAAAVHHDRIDGGLFQQHDIAGEAAGVFFVAHGVAAIFHDDDFLVVALHMRQRFGQHAGLFLGCSLRVGRGFAHDGSLARAFIKGRAVLASALSFVQQPCNSRAQFFDPRDLVGRGRQHAGEGAGPLGQGGLDLDNAGGKVGRLDGV